MRPAVAGVVLGVALAVGVPVGWAMSRPPAAAGVPVVQALAPSPPPAVVPLPTPAPPLEIAAPVRLAIPALGVDAPLDPVGVRADGQLDLPGDVDRVGWYRFGPAPGAAGSAVLAGHVDDAEQGLGVLAPLREAAPGDEVQVTDAAGSVTRWRVVGRELIEKRALPVDTLFTRTGPARLVLVTCGGPFLPDAGSYRDNVVVVAEPAG